MSVLRYLLLFSVVYFLIFGSSSISGQNIGKFSFPLTFCEEVIFEKDLSNLVASDNTNNNLYFFILSPNQIFKFSLPDNKILWKTEATGAILHTSLTQDNKILNIVTMKNSSIVFTNLSNESGVPVSQISYPITDFNFLYSKMTKDFLIKNKKDPRFYITGNEELVNLESLSDLNFAFEYSLKFQTLGKDIFFLESEDKILNTLKSNILSENFNYFPIKLDNRTEVTAFEIIPNNIIVGFNDGELILFNLQGRKIWNFKTGGKSRFVRILNDSVLAISDDNFIYLFNKNTGRLIWKYRNNGRILTPPVILDENLIISDIFENTIKILDLQSGKLLNLIVFPPNKMPVGKIIFKNDRLYFLSKRVVSIFSTSVAGC